MEKGNSDNLIQNFRTLLNFLELPPKSSNLSKFYTQVVVFRNKRKKIQLILKF